MYSYLDRWCRISVRVMGCSLACVVFLQSSVASEQQGLMEKLAEQNRANVAAVKTLVLREEVTEISIPDPGWRETYVDSMKKAREDVLKSAAAGGGGEAVLASLERDYAQRLGQADALAKIYELNCSLSLGRCRRLDFVTERARFEDVDRRDLDALLSEANLDRGLRTSLSRSKTYLAYPDHCTHLPAEGSDLAVVFELPRFKADVERLSVGLIPSWVFLDEKLVRQVVADEDAGGPLVDVSCRYAGKDRDVLRFRVRPARAYRIERWTTYHDDGQPAEEMRFEDYRLVQDAWLPFKTSVSRRNPEGKVTLTQDAKLLGAEVNVPLGNVLFEVPAGLHVQDIRVK